MLRIVVRSVTIHIVQCFLKSVSYKVKAYYFADTDFARRH